MARIRAKSSTGVPDIVNAAIEELARKRFELPAFGNACGQSHEHLGRLVERARGAPETLICLWLMSDHSTEVRKMKVTIVHDQYGNIRSVFVPCEEFSQDLSIIPENGKVAEIDTADLDKELARALCDKQPEKVVSAAQLLTEHYKLYGPEPKIIKKSG